MSNPFEKRYVNPTTRSQFTQDDITKMIDRVNSEGRELSSWEEGFMSSITEQWERQAHISEKQLGILERIYSEKTR